MHPPFVPSKYRPLLLEYIALAKTRLADFKVGGASGRVGAQACPRWLAAARRALGLSHGSLERRLKTPRGRAGALPLSCRPFLGLPLPPFPGTWQRSPWKLPLCSPGVGGSFYCSDGKGGTEG